MIVLAVKPQNLQDVIPDLKSHNENALLISILAGISVKILQNNLPKYENIIRVMPNIAIKKAALRRMSELKNENDHIR